MANEAYLSIGGGYPTFYSRYDCVALWCSFFNSDDYEKQHHQGKDYFPIATTRAVNVKGRIKRLIDSSYISPRIWRLMFPLTYYLKVFDDVQDDVEIILDVREIVAMHGGTGVMGMQVGGHYGAEYVGVSQRFENLAISLEEKDEVSSWNHLSEICNTFGIDLQKDYLGNSSEDEGKGYYGQFPGYWSLEFEEFVENNKYWKLTDEELALHPTHLYLNKKKLDRNEWLDSKFVSLLMEFSPATKITSEALPLLVIKGDDSNDKYILQSDFESKSSSESGLRDSRLAYLESWTITGIVERIGKDDGLTFIDFRRLKGLLTEKDTEFIVQTYPDNAYHFLDPNTILSFYKKGILNDEHVDHYIKAPINRLDWFLSVFAIYHFGNDIERAKLLTEKLIEINKSITLHEYSDKYATIVDYLKSKYTDGIIHFTAQVKQIYIKNHQDSLADLFNQEIIINSDSFDLNKLDETSLIQILKRKIDDKNFSDDDYKLFYRKLANNNEERFIELVNNLGYELDFHETYPYGLNRIILLQKGKEGWFEVYRSELTKRIMLLLNTFDNVFDDIGEFKDEFFELLSFGSQVIKHKIENEYTSYFGPYEHLLYDHLISKIESNYEPAYRLHENLLLLGLKLIEESDIAPKKLNYLVKQFLILEKAVQERVDKDRKRALALHGVYTGGSSSRDKRLSDPDKYWAEALINKIGIENLDPDGKNLILNDKIDPSILQSAISIPGVNQELYQKAKTVSIKKQEKNLEIDWSMIHKETLYPEVLNHVEKLENPRPRQFIDYLSQLGPDGYEFLEYISKKSETPGIQEYTNWKWINSISSQYYEKHIEYLFDDHICATCQKRVVRFAGKFKELVFQKWEDWFVKLSVDAKFFLLEELCFQSISISNAIRKEFINLLNNLQLEGGTEKEIEMYNKIKFVHRISVLEHFIPEEIAIWKNTNLPNNLLYQEFRFLLDTGLDSITHIKTLNNFNPHFQPYIFEILLYRMEDEIYYEENILSILQNLKLQLEKDDTQSPTFPMVIEFLLKLQSKRMPKKAMETWSGIWTYIGSKIRASDETTIFDFAHYSLRISSELIWNCFYTGFSQRKASVYALVLVPFDLLHVVLQGNLLESETVEFKTKASKTMNAFNFLKRQIDHTNGQIIDKWKSQSIYSVDVHLLISNYKGTVLTEQFPEAWNRENADENLRKIHNEFLRSFQPNFTVDNLEELLQIINSYPSLEAIALIAKLLETEEIKENIIEITRVLRNWTLLNNPEILVLLVDNIQLFKTVRSQMGLLYYLFDNASESPPLSVVLHRWRYCGGPVVRGICNSIYLTEHNQSIERLQIQYLMLSPSLDPIYQMGSWRAFEFTIDRLKETRHEQYVNQITGRNVRTTYQYRPSDFEDELFLLYTTFSKVWSPTTARIIEKAIYFNESTTNPFMNVVANRKIVLDAIMEDIELRKKRESRDQ